MEKHIERLSMEMIYEIVIKIIVILIPALLMAGAYSGVKKINSIYRSKETE
jgi:hypothetical protein